MPRAKPTPAAPEPELVGRFAADLDRLLAADAKLAIAVSGGPDSLALLLLAAAARAGRVEAATVDHRLRPESRAEPEMVAGICDDLGVPHSTLAVEWKHKPESAIQERARLERYRLLSRWAAERGIAAIATGHHLDDQVETLVMRLNRGSGVRGLAGMRPVAPVPSGGKQFRLLRPLLSWRRSELVELCAAASLSPADDPSNADEQFERVRIRNALAAAPWLDSPAIARSAANLRSADVALHWATDVEWERQVTRSDSTVTYRPSAPLEIRRRVVRRIVASLATEGLASRVRGRELDRLVAVLSRGGKATLRGVICSGGEEWRFAVAPPRRSAD